MKNLVLLIVLFFGVFGYAQKHRVDVVKHKFVTTAERDAYVVPSNEMWKIYNTTTGQKEINIGGAGWNVDTGQGDGYVTSGLVTNENLTLSVLNQTDPVIDLSDFALDADVNPYINENASTGIVNGGHLSINADPTKFDVDAGKGFIVDHSVDPATIQTVTWGNFTAQTVTNLATEFATDLAINAAGALVQQVSFTNQELRSLIFLGGLDHSNQTTISNVFDIQVPVAAPQSNVRELAKAVGDINLSGNIFTPNGANMNIDKSVGRVYSYGRNNTNNKLNPSELTTAAQTALSFGYIFDDGTGFGSFTAQTTNIDPDNYDNGTGTLAAVPVNDWTIQRILFFPNSNNTFIQYGGETYNTLQAAKNDITLATFSSLSAIQTASVRGYIIVQEGETSLLSADTVFYNANKFGGVSSIGGGVATSTPTLSEVLVQGNDAGSLKITGLADPTLAQDAATKTYVDTGDLGSIQNLAQVLIEGNSAGASKIVDLGNPTLPDDAATKGYVDLVGSPQNLSQVLTEGNDAGNLRITNLEGVESKLNVLRDAAETHIPLGIALGSSSTQVSYPSFDAGQFEFDADGDLKVSVNQATNLYAFGINPRSLTAFREFTLPDQAGTLALTSDIAATPTLSQVLTEGNDAGAVKITNLADPTLDQDAATKIYVDNLDALNAKLDGNNIFTGSFRIDNVLGATNSNTAIQLRNLETTGVLLGGIANHTGIYVQSNGDLSLSINTTARGTDHYRLAFPELAGVTTYTMPSTSGTLALTSDIGATPTLSEVLTAGNDAGSQGITNLTGLSPIFNAGAKNIGSASLPWESSYIKKEISEHKEFVPNVSFPIITSGNAAGYYDSTLGKYRIKQPSGDFYNVAYNATTETGTVIDLSDFRQYNTGAASASTSYTVTGAIPGGYAEALINTTSEPTITGATKLPNTADWITGTNMIMCVKVLGSSVYYFFVELP